jgi:hypothetical protein
MIESLFACVVNGRLYCSFVLSQQYRLTVIWNDNFNRELGFVEARIQKSQISFHFSIFVVAVNNM